MTILREVVFWDERFTIFITVRGRDRDEFRRFLEYVTASAEDGEIFESLNNNILDQTEEGIMNVGGEESEPSKLEGRP
jgi:hypothetical protein